MLVSRSKISGARFKAKRMNTKLLSPEILGAWPREKQPCFFGGFPSFHQESKEKKNRVAFDQKREESRINEKERHSTNPLCTFVGARALLLIFGKVWGAGLKEQQAPQIYCQHSEVSCHVPPENHICLQESAFFCRKRQFFCRKVHCSVGKCIFCRSKQNPWKKQHLWRRANKILGVAVSYS